MSQPAIITAAFGATASVAIDSAPRHEPSDSTKRPPRRSMRRPIIGASVPETSSAALKVPKRKSSEMPSSWRIGMPSTPMA
jgi:hypothetical protein